MGEGRAGFSSTPLLLSQARCHHLFHRCYLPRLPALLPSVPYHSSFFISTFITHLPDKNQNSPHSEGGLCTACALPNLACLSVYLSYLLPAHLVTVSWMCQACSILTVTPSAVSVPGSSVHHHSYTSVEFFFFRNWLKIWLLQCPPATTTSKAVIPHYPPLYITFFFFSVLTTTYLFTELYLGNLFVEAIIY